MTRTARSFKASPHKRLMGTATPRPGEALPQDFWRGLPRKGANPSGSAPQEESRVRIMGRNA